MFGLQIKYLSFFFGLISILSFFNIIYSYYFNFYLNLDTYYFSLFLSSILAILFYSLKISPKKTSIFQKDDTVVLLSKRDQLPIVENMFRISSI